MTAGRYRGFYFYLWQRWSDRRRSVKLPGCLQVRRCTALEAAVAAAESTADDGEVFEEVERRLPSERDVE